MLFRLGQLKLPYSISGFGKIFKQIFCNNYIVTWQFLRYCLLVFIPETVLQYLLIKIHSITKNPITLTNKSLHPRANFWRKWSCSLHQQCSARKIIFRTLLLFKAIKEIPETSETSRHYDSKEFRGPLYWSPIMSQDAWASYTTEVVFPVWSLFGIARIRHYRCLNTDFNFMPILWRYI